MAKKRYKSRNKSQQATERLLEYKKQRGLKCSICGYKRNHAALGWHHLEPSCKKFEISSYARKRRNWKEVEKEIRKCVLICQNCLAEVHYPHANIKEE